MLLGKCPLALHLAVLREVRAASAAYLRGDEFSDGLDLSSILLEEAAPAGEDSPKQTRRRDRWLAWLGESGDHWDDEPQEMPITPDAERRLHLAWSSLDLQVRGLGRASLTGTLFAMLQRLPIDSAVALLRMASTARAAANYTEHILSLAKQHKISLPALRHQSGQGTQATQASRKALERAWQPVAGAASPQWLQSLVRDGPARDQQTHILAVRPRNGVGNRLLAVVSAAALALMLNRSLVVLWEDAMFESILATASVDAAVVADHLSAVRTDVKSLTLVSGWEGFRQDADTLACKSASNLIHHSKTSSLNNLSSILFVESDQFFLPLLQLPHLQDVMQSDFCTDSVNRSLREHDNAVCRQAGIDTAVGSRSASASTTLDLTGTITPWVATNTIAKWSSLLLKQLFRLSPPMQARVSSEADRLFKGSSFVLGIHVRTRMYDYEKELVPEPELSDILACIDAALKLEAPEKGKHIIFLATPSEAVKQAVKKRFGKRVRTRRKIVTDRSSSAGEVDAVVDLSLLSMADALVTSVHSTFGYVAQSLSGCAPYVLTDPKEEDKGGDGNLVSRHCRKLRSSCPCFHAGRALLRSSVPGAHALSCKDTAMAIAEDFGPWAPCRFR
eukprot:TRINITY_DN33213_c0_g1_i1.p1 TRINITY_DN33213_c0_g1~~TRINITY_DN33213_c0_g1_i1.p1  ORF type:complete len:619 (+),score=73.42 TRINITY_DN33213_c0_g1_i1:102-1958(+)